MFNLFTLVQSVLVSHAVVASPLPAKDADMICRKKALLAAHFISESDRPFVVKYKAAKVAEISTPIAYTFTYAGVEIDEPLFTVHAYAYPGDKSCTIGKIINNLAGND